MGTYQIVQSVVSRECDKEGCPSNMGTTHGRGRESVRFERERKAGVVVYWACWEKGF